MTEGFPNVGVLVFLYAATPSLVFVSSRITASSCTIVEPPTALLPRHNSGAAVRLLNNKMGSHCSRRLSAEIVRELPAKHTRRPP